MQGSQLDPRPQTYTSTLGAWEESPPTRSVSWDASSNPQEDNNLHYPLSLQKRLEVRRGQSGVLACASLGCLRPKDRIEKSGSWKQREQQWMTTTPNMLRGTDACAMNAGCPCGPRAGSAAPRSAAGEAMAEPSQASTPAPAAQPRPLQSPAPAPISTPTPSQTSAPTPVPTPAPAPAPAAAPAGSTGTGGPGVGSGGTGSGGDPARPGLSQQQRASQRKAQVRGLPRAKKLEKLGVFSACKVGAGPGVRGGGAWDILGLRWQWEQSPGWGAAPRPWSTGLLTDPSAFRPMKLASAMAGKTPSPPLHLAWTCSSQLPT